MNFWAILDLNQGPRDYESPALTTELMARIVLIIYQKSVKKTIRIQKNYIQPIDFINLPKKICHIPNPGLK